MEIDTIENLTDELNKYEDVAIFAIEGFCQSGKTYLGNMVSKSLKIEFLDTDDYLLEKGFKKHYTDLLDLKRLSQDLVERPKVVAGLCLREIFNIINARNVVYVYVKEISKNGFWNEGINLECVESGQDELPPEPHASAYKYHFEHSPHTKANFVFNRQENSA